MTQEEKQLLFTDLCTRYPHGVKICVGDYICTLLDINTEMGDKLNGETFHIVGFNKPDGNYDFCAMTEVKPYLRPMSSMTEEENEIATNISNKGKGFEEDEDGWIRCDSIHTKWGVWPDGCAKLLDYLNSIHIDYRGLIPMGLALEAPEGMYKTE